MRALLLLLLPGILLAQSDSRLSTETMPRLEDALIPLPEPLTGTFVRENLDSLKSTPAPRPDELLKQVVNELKTRQFSQALPKLEYLQALRPSEPDILILRGCIYAESGHPEMAENIFRRAIAIAPAHPWARLNLAEAQLAQKKYADAEATLSVLAVTRPESEVVRFKLILALVLQKKTPAAEQECNTSRSMLPLPPIIMPARRLLLARATQSSRTNPSSRDDTLMARRRSVILIARWSPRAGFRRRPESFPVARRLESGRLETL